MRIRVMSNENINAKRQSFRFEQWVQHQLIQMAMRLVYKYTARWQDGRLDARNSCGSSRNSNCDACSHNTNPTD